MTELSQGVHPERSGCNNESFASNDIYREFPKKANNAHVVDSIVYQANL